METQHPGLLAEKARGNWVSLRTLVVLRWIAIIGQVTALTIAREFYNLSLNLGLCYAVICLALIANLVSTAVYPGNKRLSEREIFLMLLFDIGQLSALLFLTGGLHNPFALLVLAPVTISATALQQRSTVVISAVAVLAVTLLVFFHFPLLMVSGEILLMPDLFLFGNWAAICIGIVFVAIYDRRVSSEIQAMNQALLATQMALAREQKLTDLGGVVAAAAHELGTPLATIKLLSSELAEELNGRPELRGDAELIREQADRCRDILQSMGRAGKRDPYISHVPLGALIREAAEPHFDRGPDVKIDLSDEFPQPSMARRPEVIHGLRNLVQNAVDFADTTVWIDAMWTEERIEIRIVDDGPGYPPDVLSRIGQPFVNRRGAAGGREKRTEYEGMGLGLFIAKTLLERSGAELGFANGQAPTTVRKGPGTRSGAIVDVAWPRVLITQGKDATNGGLGENLLIEA